MKKLLTAINGRIPIRDQYTAGEIAFLMGVSHRTACKFIDDGTITGFRLPSALGCRQRERRVHHNAVVAFVEKNPKFKFMLDKLILDYVPPPGVKPCRKRELEKRKLERAKVLEASGKKGKSNRSLPDMKRPR